MKSQVTEAVKGFVLAICILACTPTFMVAAYYAA